MVAGPKLKRKCCRIFLGKSLECWEWGDLKGPLGSGDVDLCRNWPEHQRRAVVVVSIKFLVVVSLMFDGSADPVFCWLFSVYQV